MADGALLGLSGEVRYTGERFFGLSPRVRHRAIDDLRSVRRYGNRSQLRYSALKTDNHSIIYDCESVAAAIDYMSHDPTPVLFLRWPSKPAASRGS